VEGEASPSELADVERLLDRIGDRARQECEAWARTALAGSPLVLRGAVDDPRARRRRRLQIVAAAAAARRGERDALIALHWSALRDRRGSALPLMRLLVEADRPEQAAVLARWVLASPDCEDRDAIQALLRGLGRPPDGWDDAVAAFAARPSVEAWERLMTFCPPDVFYQRARNTLQALVGLGVDGDVLFRCATRYGTTPEAIELVDRGLVDPETCVRRGDEGTTEARGLWLGLAAQAAFARGDRFGTVRLLREAYRVADPAFPPIGSMLSIREQADDALREMLDRAGVPSDS
jgi:hypothetical protein